MFLPEGQALMRVAIRWILALPAGVLAAAIVAFPIHWLVMVNLGGWSREPLIEIRDPDVIRWIEQFLQALFGPLAFVYCSARSVPRYNRLVAVLLTVAIVFGLPLFNSWWNSGIIASGHGVLFERDMLRTLASVVGCTVAVWLIHRFHTRNAVDDGCARLIEREDAQTTVGQSHDLTEAKGDNDDDDSGSRTKLSWSLVLWGAFIAYACFVFDPPTVLTIVCALMILVPLFLGSIAATSLLISLPIEELSIFHGPTLYEHRFPSFVLRINSIPLGGNVKSYPNVYERSHISKKLLLCLPGCLCLFLVAAICLGAEASMYSIVEGIRQIAIGAISPLGTGRRLVSAAHEYLRTEPFGVALGMVAAKQCAIELLPLSTSSGGRFFLHILKSILPVKERIEVALAVASVLISLMIVAMWGVAMVGYHLMQ